MGLNMLLSFRMYVEVLIIKRQKVEFAICVFNVCLLFACCLGFETASSLYDLGKSQTRDPLASES